MLRLGRSVLKYEPMAASKLLRAGFGLSRQRLALQNEWLHDSSRTMQPFLLQSHQRESPNIAISHHPVRMKQWILRWGLKRRFVLDRPKEFYLNYQKWRHGLSLESQKNLIAADLAGLKNWSPMSELQAPWMCASNSSKPSSGGSSSSSSGSRGDDHDDPNGHLQAARRRMLAAHDRLRRRTKDRLEATRDRLEATKDRFQATRAKVRAQMQRENIVTIPNALCVARIALTPLLGYFVIIGNFEPALYIFAFAGITDLLDGQIARRFPSQKSVLGSFLDPLADKLLVATLFASLTVIGHIPIPLTLLIIARDAALVAAGSYVRYTSLPEPKTLAKYFDASLPTAKIQPTMLSKINTTIQLSLVGFTLAAPVFGFVGHPALAALCWITAGSTIASFISYILAKDTYKILTKRARGRLRSRQN